MPPLDEETFRRLFRGLSANRRVAFVCDLWAACGWDVERTDGVLLATRDDTEQRIRIVDPGRLRTPSVEDAEIVVTTRDSARLREAVAAASNDYVTPAALRERLLYAIDRETAAKLVRTHFDQPLETTEPHLAPSLWSRLRALGARISRQAQRPEEAGSARLTIGLLGLVLLALLAGAAVAGPAIVPQDDAAQLQTTPTFTPGEAGAVGEETPTPTATPTATPSRYPPGVSSAGIEDRSRLLAAHREGVKRQSRTLRVRASGPPNATLMAGRTAWNYTARIEQHWQYQFDAVYRSPPEGTNQSIRVAVYANGGTNYRRTSEPGGVTYQRYPTEAAGYASKYTDEVVRYFETFLQGEQSTVECLGGSNRPCRIEVTGAPSTLPDGVADYRAIAVVQHSGVVSSLAVSYTLPDADADGAREEVRFALDYRAVGRTTTTEPAWLPEAKNEADG